MDPFLKLAEYGPYGAIIAVLLFMLWDSSRRTDKSIRESIEILAKTVEQIRMATEANGGRLERMNQDCLEHYVEVREMRKVVDHLRGA